MTDKPKWMPEPVAWRKPHEFRSGTTYSFTEVKHHVEDWAQRGVTLEPMFTADQLAAVRREALEEAAKACEAEEVDFGATHAPEDRAYNMAIEHCAAALRALKEQP